MENTFNKNPITQISGTLCKCMAINPPKFANSYMPELTSALLSQIDNTAFDRVLIFNPDAIGQWIYEKYYNKFELVRKHAPLEVKMLSVVPPKTPVCFASIYTGATPEEHGICHYEKPVLKIDTLFDALIRAGKKPCIVSVAEQSMDLIFRGKDMDYFSLPYDSETVDKAIELIKQDQYDFIAVYVQEYDDRMHRSSPQSKSSLRAIDNYSKLFDKLITCAKENWQQHNTLVAYMPDHGVHREWYLLGQHGKNIPKDMNIVHFYGVIKAKK